MDPLPRPSPSSSDVTLLISAAADSCVVSHHCHIQEVKQLD